MNKPKIQSALRALGDTLDLPGAPRRWRLLSDDDGHYYLVPAEREEEDFNLWVDSFNEDENGEGDPDGFAKLGAKSLGCSPTCVSSTDPRVD